MEKIFGFALDIHIDGDIVWFIRCRVDIYSHMQKRMIISNGKKYLVNVPGWEDGIGSAAEPGTLWMQSSNLSWYQIELTGTSASVSMSVGQSPILQPMLGQEFGYQLLQSTNGNVYKIFLSGSNSDVSMSVSQSAWGSTLDYKSSFILRSSDSNYYSVYASSSGTPATTSLVIDQNSQRSQFLF